MAKFARLIIESVDTYRWKFKSTDGNRAFYGFDTEQYSYEVVAKMGDVYKKNNYIYTNFLLTRKTAGDLDPVHGETNEGKPFRVVATVVEILKDVWEKRESLFDIGDSAVGFEFRGGPSGEEVDGKMTQRKKLYMRFIKRHFRDAEIKHPSSSKTKVKLV